MTRKRLILAVLLISQLLIWLDNTILGTAFETLADPGRGLGATPGQLQWAAGAYTLVIATLMFTAGALGDRFGHRTVLLSGLAVFGASSFWAAYASSADQLVAARAVMGVGGALIMPASMAVLTWTFDGPARAGAFAVLSVAAGVGIGGGPVLAGVLLGHFWWGSVFLVNVPVVLAGLIGVRLLVPNFRSPVKRPLDLAGLALSVTGLGALAYGLIRAGQVAGFGSAEVWGPIAAGLLLIAALIRVELRSKAPSFNPRLFKNRAFAGGNTALGLLFVAMTANSFFAAFYLQGARGFTAFEAGLAALPVAVGVTVGAPLSTRLVRRWTVGPVTGLALGTAGLAMGCFAFFGLDTPLVWNELLVFVQGLTIGMVIAPVTNAVISTLPLERAGSGSAVANTLRQAGGVLGIALGGTITTLAYRDHIRPALTGLPDATRQQAETSAELARHAAAGNPGLAAAADDAFIHAMHVTTLCTMAIALAGAAVLLGTFRQVRRSGVRASLRVEERELVE